MAIRSSKTDGPALGERAPQGRGEGRTNRPGHLKVCLFPRPGNLCGRGEAPSSGGFMASRGLGGVSPNSLRCAGVGRGDRDRPCGLDDGRETECTLGEVFDSVAEDYDMFRRGYPAVLVDAAIERGGLVSGSLVLEVGCGTGKLTELLTARELNVDAVDPGPRMIELAKRRVGDRDDVRFHVGRFEDVPLPEKAFDAVFSATAFHWVDPLVGWAKAASHLRPRGLLALLAHMTVHDERSAAADEGFRELLSKHAPTLAEGRSPARDLDAILAGARQRAGNVSDVWDWVMGAGRRQLTNIDAADLFGDVDVTAQVTTIGETADEFFAHFRTTSLYFEIDAANRLALEDDTRQLIEGLGGVATFALATVLLTAPRTADPLREIEA